MNAPLSHPMRLATPDDGPALAELVNFAGEGLPLYLWKRLAEPGQDPWVLGAERQATRAAKGQIIAIDEGAGVVAAMTGYPIDAPEEVTDETPPMFGVMTELENLVVGTWYLNVLATYPRARGRGLGALLIRQAEDIAVAGDRSGVSIIVADKNHGARRLYERLGYQEIDRRPMIKETWENHSTEWVLLLKEIDK
ncbi:MAG: GNAT family N-acetyltransferase [Pseudomonadota bacterium]